MPPFYQYTHYSRTFKGNNIYMQVGLVARRYFFYDRAGVVPRCDLEYFSALSCVYRAKRAVKSN